MVTVKRAEPKSSAEYPVKFLVCVTEEQAERLDEVMSMGDAVHSRSAGVRRLIDVLSDDDLDSADAAEGKEVFSPADVSAILAALDERTRTYSELNKQVRAVGRFLNTLTKLGHQLAKYGKAGVIPVPAIETVETKVERILDRASVMAHQDAYVEQVVRSCRRR